MPDRPPDRQRRRLLLASGAVALGATAAPGRAAAQTAGGPMPLGIIGSGHIGSTVGGLWVRAGHPVLFSSRHPEELSDLVTRLGPLARAGSVAQAIAFGHALLIAVPYRALPQIGRDDAAALGGKVVLDA